jgi:DNA-binding transcriptional LysR family regulator
MLHSRRLIYINEIARTGSIRKAAETLNVASSAINRQILALEKEIGTQLFERLPRGLRLTAAGELYIEHVRDTLKSYKKLESRVTGLKTSHSGRITMVSTAGLIAGPLPAIVADFLQSHPRVNIFLRSDSGSTTLAPVIGGEVDVGLGFNISSVPGLRVIASFDVPIGVILPPSHKLAAQKTIQLADLAQERLLLAQTGTSLRDVIDLALATASLKVSPVVESSATELLKQLVQKGVGLTLLNPLDVINECSRGDLVFRPLGDTRVKPQVLKLFARAKAPLDTVASLFIEFLSTELSQVLKDLNEKPMA